MRAPSSRIHVMISRHPLDPRNVRWYVRHVWWSPDLRGAFDRVVCQGQFEQEPSESLRQGAILALRAALAELESAPPMADQG